MTRQDLMTEAAEIGAERALARLGLGDPEALGDLSELRQLLQAWRDAKASARQAVVEWIVRAVLCLLLLGIAFRFGALGILK